MLRKIRMVLADDEVEAVNLLRHLIAKIPEAEIVGTSRTVSGLSRQVLKLNPDIVLLDILMPPGNGLDVADDLLKHGYQGKIVFTTAYSQYALDAIKRSAFDYLLKPIDLDDLKLLVNKLQDEWAIKFSENGMLPNTKIKINTRSGFMLMSALEVIYIKADGNYSKLHLLQDKKEITSMNLGRLLEILPSKIFFRISRSVIINLHYLRKVDRKSLECELHCDGRSIKFNMGVSNLKQLETII